MPSASRSLARPRPAPPPPLRARQAPLALVDTFGAVGGEHALVLGPDAIDAVCDLIHAGCSAAATLPIGQRPERGSADLVVVPRVSSRDEAATSLAQADRALTEAGRIVLRTAADPDGRLGRAIAAGLRGHGYSDVRIRPTAGRSVVTGARPPFGPDMFGRGSRA